MLARYTHARTFQQRSNLMKHATRNRISVLPQAMVACKWAHVAHTKLILFAKSQSLNLQKFLVPGGKTFVDQ